MVQVLATQSRARLHIRKSSQRGQPAESGPPQSTSVSEPFMTPSVQVGAWHSPPVQLPDVQSLPTAHISVTAQRSVQVAPPQSTSVSS